MAKPVILTVDDDLDVLRAVERDLRRQYGKEYRVVRADSGAAALDALRQLRLRNDPVALLLTDQRMPRQSGVEFLEQARQEGLFTDAKRVLLTAYADTDAAIRAINGAQIDYYLLKPWDPPEQGLYPVLNDLLDDWMANYRPPFEGLRVIGNRWSPQSHEVKDFLARNHVPYQWMDVETSQEGQRLIADAGGLEQEGARLPLVLLPDGGRVWAPEPFRLAEKVGLKTRAEQPFYDIVIVGAGPAGLAAAVYGASEGLRTLMIEREAPGGQAGQSSRIENYLGFPVGLSGADLARRAVTQAARFGVEVLRQEVTGVRVEGPYRIVKLADGAEVSCHALMIASGVSYRKLDAPGIERLTGCGVYYGAAMTEAMSCRDESVYVIGGANSAGQAAMYFSKYAGRVTILTRSPLEKGMSHYLIEQIAQTPNIAVRTGAAVVEAAGGASLERITIANAETGERETMPATALFIFIGAAPRTEWLDGVIERDAQGFILTGPDLMKDGKRPKGWTADRDPFLLEASVPGIFVVGDVRKGSIKRVASGVGEGSIAVSFVHQYLSKV